MRNGSYNRFYRICPFDDELKKRARERRKRGRNRLGA
jgi:hypothetical protein